MFPFAKSLNTFDTKTPYQKKNFVTLENESRAYRWYCSISLKNGKHVLQARFPSILKIKT
jgi:hypothetical protein